MNFISPALRRARELYGKTQREVASEMDVSLLAIKLAEASREPSDLILEWYSKHFRADLEELRRARAASNLPKAGSQ